MLLVNLLQDPTQTRLLGLMHSAQYDLATDPGEHDWGSSPEDSWFRDEQECDPAECDDYDPDNYASSDTGWADEVY